MIARRDFLRATSLGLGSLMGLSRGFAQEPEENAKPPRLQPSEPLARRLAAIRDKHDVPGLIAGLVIGETLDAIAAVGVRKLGAPEPFRVDDQVHLGSDTKAMTATMIGSVIDEGKLGWSTTLREVFPEQAVNDDQGLGRATLWDLLTHRAGLPANALWSLLGRDRSTTDQRRELLARMLRIKPRTEPGTKFAYSNVGYALAGLMAEQVTGRSWETLLRERLFEPLGMDSAGFGPPGTPGEVDQPWGHRALGNSFVPLQADNSPALGPAGTVHCSFPDWARFAALHLRAAQGRPRLLKEETFRKLHTPPGGELYAGGWLVAPVPWARGTVLSHAGSNTMWYVNISIVPERDLTLLTATNCGGPGEKACEDAEDALRQHEAASCREP